MDTHKNDECRFADDLLSHVAGVIAERRATYGPATEHFARTVGAANAILAGKLRTPLTVSDWAVLMILDKLARSQGDAPTADTVVDVIGYGVCMAMVNATRSAAASTPAAG